MGFGVADSAARAGLLAPDPEPSSRVQARTAFSKLE